MVKTLPITQAREEFTSLVDNAKRKFNEYIITVNGSPAAVLISADEYESWKETNDILSDPDLMKSLRKAEKEVKQGKVYSYESIKKELGITTA